MATLTHADEIVAYKTKDGSLIYELMHPASQSCHNQSLAKAVVDAGERTALHQHFKSEELYHITLGEGQMTLGNEKFGVKPGDTVCIAPSTPHCIENTGSNPLHFLCLCAPAYQHADTELLPNNDD